MEHDARWPSPTPSRRACSRANTIRWIRFPARCWQRKYVARLYFAETEGVSAAGERVFSFNVHGREFKDFDIWAKAGGSYRAYVETVPVEVTNGTFRVTFTSKVENLAINAIELIPAIRGRDRWWCARARRCRDACRRGGC